MSAMREKRHRLSRERYSGEQTVAFTTRVLDGRPLFENSRAANDFAAILIAEADRRAGDVLLACFMPDHVHALLRGRCAESDVLEAFYRFKLRTGVVLDRFYRPHRWQKDFYDHIVRCDGDWIGQARYVALNSVRGGLVEDPFNYALNYSSLDTRQEILAQIFWES